jgi:hypothetical protein
MVRVAEGKRNFCDGRVSCGEQMPGAGEFHVVDGLKKLVFACAQFGSVEFDARRGDAMTEKGRWHSVGKS